MKIIDTNQNTETSSVERNYKSGNDKDLNIYNLVKVLYVYKIEKFSQKIVINKIGANLNSEENLNDLITVLEDLSPSNLLKYKTFVRIEAYDIKPVSEIKKCLGKKLIMEFNEITNI